MKENLETDETKKVEAPVKSGFWNGVKQTTGKLWQTVKANPWKALATGVALALPPVGTAIGAGVIAGTIGKKSYDTYKEQKTEKVIKGQQSKVIATRKYDENMVIDKSPQISFGAVKPSSTPVVHNRDNKVTQQVR